MINFNDDNFKKRQFVSTLTRDNEKTWFRLMKMYLDKKKFWKNVTQSQLSILYDATFFDEKLNVQTQFILVQCIDIENKKHTMMNITTKNIWVFLWKKYKKKLKTIDRQYVENWIIYKKSSNKSIEQTWVEINILTRKIQKTQLNFEMLIFTSNRIQFFFKTFSNEYFVIRDIIDVQNENNYEIILQKL